MSLAFWILVAVLVSLLIGAGLAVLSLHDDSYPKYLAKREEHNDE